MKPSTAILAVVALALSVFAIARQVNQPPEMDEAPAPVRPAWGWIGCRLGDVDDDAARELGLDVPQGVVITQAIDDSPGKLSGLRDNDVVRRMDDKPIRTTGDLRDVVRTTKPGQVMNFTIIRDKKEQVIPVKLGERPVPPVPKPPELPN